MHDKDDGDGYADAHESNLHHPRKYQPRGQENIYLIKEEKYETEKPRGLVPGWNAQPLPPLTHLSRLTLL